MTRPRSAAVLLSLAFSLAPGLARADSYLESRYRLTTLVSLTWEAGAPLQDLRSYVDEPSYRGGQLDVRFGVTRHLSLGLATSWNWFTQNFAHKTVSYPNATVTAAVYDRVQFITLRGTLHWYLLDGPVQPYLGLGAGGVWHSTFQAVADLASRSHGFDFTADPNLGVLFTIGPGFAVHLAARYQYTLADFRGVERARWLGASLGLAAY